MRNIFLFIRRYFTFICFLALQAASLWFLFNYNRFHRARGLGFANQVTGWFNTRYNKVEDFVSRGEETRRVHRMNDSLVNLLNGNFLKKDSGSRVIIDTVVTDTVNRYRRYLWKDAQVVYNTIHEEKNYIQIDKGSRDGIHDDMGVFSSDGSLVGKVINVSPNFSQVMSLLHVQNKVNVIVKKTRSGGTISWNGRDPRYLTLNNIPKSDSIVAGDTIITGAYSLNIPPNWVVGTVAEIIPDNTTNFYVLKIKTAANFADLQQVFVVENLQYAEQNALLDETRKKVDDPKQNRK